MAHANRNVPLCSPLFDDTIHIDLELGGEAISDITRLFENDSTEQFFKLGNEEWAISKSSPRQHGNSFFGKFNPSSVLMYGSLYLGLRMPSGIPAKMKARAIISGQACLVNGGAKNCWSLVVSELTAAGFDILGNKVNRVDIATDVCHPFTEFKQRFDDRYFIPAKQTCKVISNIRVEERSVRNSHATFYIGSDPKLRCYDKIAELAQGQPHKQDMQENCWKDCFGKLPQAVTRVEFQLRRKYLKKVNINEAQDWFDKRLNIWKTLTSKWIRFTENAPDRLNGNQSRSQIWCIWENIQELSTQPPLSAKQVKTQPNVRKLEDKALVSLLQPLILQCDEPTSEELLLYLSQIVRMRHKTRTFEDLLKKAKSRVISNYGAKAIGSQPLTYKD